MPAKRWAPWDGKDDGGSGSAQRREVEYRGDRDVGEASGGHQSLGADGAAIEEEAVDEEELKLIELAMNSAESACRLAKSQVRV